LYYKALYSILRIDTILGSIDYAYTSEYENSFSANLEMSLYRFTNGIDLISDN